MESWLTDAAEKVEVARLFTCLLVLLLTTLLAAISAGFSVFIHFLMEDNPLGKWYGGILMRMPEWIAKPLGECVFCSGSWQFLAFSYLLFDINLWVCFLGLGVNHLAITLLMRWWMKAMATMNSTSTSQNTKA